MELDLNGRRLTIVVGESDRFGHHSLSSEIVQRAHTAGLAGATVFRGVEGFGASSQLHTSRLLSLADDLPLAIVIVDRTPRIEAFVAGLADVRGAGLMTLEPIAILGWVAAGAPADAGAATGSGCRVNRGRAQRRRRWGRRRR